MSDNGQPFSAATFSKFADEWGFTHLTSSPYYPQSNEEVERAVKTAKVYLSNQLLMGRKLRSTLPLALEKLKPGLVNVEQLKKNEQTYKCQQTQNYSKRNRSIRLSDLSPAETVWLPEMSSPAVVVSKSPAEPRSYIVKKERGTVRRNRRQVVSSPKETGMRELQSTSESTGENISCPNTTSDNVVRNR